MTGGGVTGVALELRDVTVRYPDARMPALERVALSIAGGEILAVAGESGSGKTTLARVAAGLLRPAAGAVLVDGIDARRARPRALAARVGLVFQNPNHQLLTATVHDELALGPRNLGLSPAAAERAADETARRLGLAAVAGEHPYRLGTALRRRVALGAVLSMRPRVLVLDEPTSGQGPLEVDDLAALLAEEARRGVAVLLVTHDLRFAGSVADRLLVLRGGRVEAEGRAPVLLADVAGMAAAGLESPPLVRLAAGLGLDPAIAARGLTPGVVAAVAARTRGGATT